MSFRDDGKKELTLWVGLSAVLLASRVQGNNLVANYVVARCDVGWNGHRRGEVVGYIHTHTHMLVRIVISAEGGKRGKKSSAHTHHVIAGPDARSSGAIIQTIGLNFDEAEIGLCNIGELASNRCEVGDDRTMVGFRPSVPAQWERRVSKVSRRSVGADGSIGFPLTTGNRCWSQQQLGCCSSRE